jgi:dolichol-phosphate mannosyltransferase
MASDAPSPVSAVVTIVVPTYNEADNLPELIRRICGSLPDVEVLVVDDASEDGTADAVRRLAVDWPVRVVERFDERGLATAVLRGFKEARTELCVVMDADLSHPPESIPGIVRAVLEGADVAVGSRYARGGDIQNWPFRRRMTSWMGTLLARPLTPVRDPMAGFFGLRRGLLEGVELKPKGFKILLEILARTGTKKVVEIPIRFEDRSAGATKFSSKERKEFLQQVGILYRDLNAWPLRLLKFLCTGALGILPNLAILNLLLRVVGTSQDAAAAAGWFGAMTFNYVLNREWTFRAGEVPVVSSYVKYALGALGGLGVQLAVMHALPKLHYNLSALLGIAAGTIFNYVVSQLWAFSKKAKR